MFTKISISFAVMVSLTQPVHAVGYDEDMATKLVAVGSFVKTHCAGMKPNVAMINAAIARIGIDPIELKNRAIQGEAIVRVLASDVKTSCRVIWEGYGKNGSAVPGVIEQN